MKFLWKNRRGQSLARPPTEAAREEPQAKAQGEIDKEWSRGVAVLGVDELVRAKIVGAPDFDRAVEIVAEEILVRLALEDRPTADNWRFKKDQP
jgi:hypothetical protein